MWLIFTMKGILWAYWREQSPSTPKVVATALQPPSMASSTMFFGSKYLGLGANDAAAECSMPWSTGRIDTCPVPASRPWPNRACRLRSTWGDRSLSL